MKRKEIGIDFFLKFILFFYFFYVEFLLRRSCRYGFFKHRITSYQLNVFIIILLTLSYLIFKGEHSVNHINIYGHWDKEKKIKMKHCLKHKNHNKTFKNTRTKIKIPQNIGKKILITSIFSFWKFLCGPVMNNPRSWVSVEQHALKLVPSTDYPAHQEYGNWPLFYVFLSFFYNGGHDYVAATQGTASTPHPFTTVKCVFEYHLFAKH